MIALPIAVAWRWPPAGSGWLGFALIALLVSLPGAFLLVAAAVTGRAALALDDEGVSVTGVRGDVVRTRWTEIGRAMRRRGASAMGLERPAALVLFRRDGRTVVLGPAWGAGVVAVEQELRRHGITVGG